MKAPLNLVFPNFQKHFFWVFCTIALFWGLFQVQNGFSQSLPPIILTINEPQIGDSIGQLQISNPAPNTTYIYKLVDDSAVNATFDIDTLTGIFWVKDNAWVDADKFSQVNFSGTAKVLGTGINSFSALITINLIDIAESSASAPVYTLLKRPDEKYLTELAFDNPYFVEDVVRNIAAKLEKDNRIDYYLAEVESEESIHTHNATARIEKNKNTRATYLSHGSPYVLLIMDNKR